MLSSIRIAPFVNFPMDSSPLFQAYGSRTDGEGIETAWANQSPHLPSRVRNMPAGERRDRLDDKNSYSYIVGSNAQLALTAADDDDDDEMPDLVSVKSEIACRCETASEFTRVCTSSFNLSWSLCQHCALSQAKL